MFKKNSTIAKLVWGILLLGAFFVREPWSASADDAPTVEDFRYVVEIFEAGPERIAKSEIVCREGTFYQFFSRAREEVVVMEVSPSFRVTLIDLKRKVQCQVHAVELAAHLDRLRRGLASTVRKLEASEERGDRVSAEMIRDLAEPRFHERFDEEKRSLLLENASVTIEALGETEAARERLRLLRVVLENLATFASMREPDDVPPFAMRQTIQRFLGERNLLPREISMTVRLAGPPRKVRWVYQLVPTLTDREREAIRRVELLRATATFVSFRNYEE